MNKLFYVIALFWALIFGSCSDSKKNAGSWIQGEWSGMTPLGEFRLTIEGNRIIDRMGDEIQKGTFVEDNGKLRVHYEGDPSDLYTIYELDEENYRIGVGQGYYLWKTSK